MHCVYNAKFKKCVPVHVVDDKSRLVSLKDLLRSHVNAGYKPHTNAGYKPHTNAGYKPHTNAGYKPHTNAGYKPHTNAGYKSYKTFSKNVHK